MTDVGRRTTKQTYVTKYTTDVDPRTLPDFASRGVVTGEEWQGGSSGRQQRIPHRAAPPGQHGHLPSYSPSATPSVGDSNEDTYGGSSSNTGSGHRLRKKYTTTTVTTITTTTILLPKMQEAYVLPSMTSRQMEQQSHPYPAIADGQGYEEVQPQLSRQQQQERGRVYQIDSGRISAKASPERQRQLQSSGNNRLVPSQPQLGPDGQGTQSWVFHQQTANTVTTEANHGRLPTLEELGITSYFAKDNTASQPQRAAPDVQPSRNGTDQQQPWVAAETRHEVEGGKRYY
jgi:hypothetical protein